MKPVQVIGMIAIFATSSLAQNDVGATTSSATTASDSVSGTTNTQTVVFVTGSSAASATASESVSSSTSGELSSEQLGGIIGGCAGAVILIVFSIILIVFGRKRRSNDFDMAVGVSSTTLNELKGLPNSKGGRQNSKSKQYSAKGNEKNVKRYNFNGKSDIENGPVIAPVVIYSDTLNQEQQQAMGIEKHMLDEEATPLRDQPSEKRLSKYNFLSQAFSQMRTSYAPDNANNNEDQPRSPSSASAASQKELIVKKPKKYQMYSMYQDSNNELQTPPPAHSVNSFIPGDPTRESTVTVGTLHAPLFKSRGTPSPTTALPKKMIPHRDSLVSEVSEYSTYPTSPNPSSTPTKRYPFI